MATSRISGVSSRQPSRPESKSKNEKTARKAPSSTEPQKMRCSQCLEQFKDPRLLNCYHTFCCDCLKIHLDASDNKESLQCPLCKSETKLPDDGVNGIQRNYYVNSSDNNEAVKCDVCGEKTKAEYSCLDCAQNYCAFCLKFHSKLQGTKDHRVATVDESGSRKVKMSMALCKEHVKQELSYFCDTCQDLICIDCNMTTHKTHECQSLVEASEKFKQILSSAINKSEQQEVLTGLQDVKKKLKQKANQGSDKNDKLLETIEKQARHFCDLVNDVKAELISQVMEQVGSTVNGVKEETADLDRQIISFQALIQFSELLLAQAEAVDITMHGAKVADKIEKIKRKDEEHDEEREPSDESKSFEFEKYELVKDEIKEMFGKLIDQNEKEEGKVAEFACKDQEGIITAIAPCDDETAWICFGNEGILQRYSLRGKCLNTIEVGHKVDDMLKMGEDLYLSCNAKQKIILYNGTFSTFTRSKLCARGLAQSANQDFVIVALTEKDVFFNCSDDPSASLIKVNTDGKQKKIQGQNETKYPARIASSENGNIVISDWIELQITITDSEGNYLHRFKGDRKNDFIPRGVCCGTGNTIYVIDSETHSVLKLDSEAKFMKKVETVENCWSIAKDQSGKLWIGSQDGTVTVLEDK
ncbi:hypothetical protein FSP39_002094 [Pinctada imbricata]|uniref:Uncharacterized protein n=1 Tax=Pinctada imbricata TaxID=66713 RepID=A0AA88Y526_PINIB|nr:hypothetical protein FSP39_002094 [Pinctada imbricata]